ncbi:hypothetical protein [Sphingomonas koreensis]|uniref:hypothetical protein n=1 Tax=Sphingomonas koreensis TaxID=93064 RepID=UPI000F7E9AE5|nr:hypothetical protein [Sphingomonas koreensis]
MNGELAGRYGRHADSQALGRIASRLSELAAECAALDRADPALAVPQDLRAARHPDDIAQRVHRYLVARRARSKVLDGDWFADPAWDLLLDLLAAQYLGRRVSISSACIATHVPSTTALRWIDKLVEEGALMREDDPADGRRSYLGLAPELAVRLEQWIERHLPDVGGPGHASTS